MPQTNRIFSDTAAPRNSVEVNTSNGRGSTNTVIRRFTTIKTSIGTAITYTDSATLGSTFTINESGVYSITTVEGGNVTNGHIYAGISKNSVNLTTSIAAVPNTERLSAYGFNGTVGGSSFGTSTWTGPLAIGDVIRPHVMAEDPAVAADSMFIITKVSN